MRTFIPAILLLFLDTTFGQPATLTLRAKLRDFKDHLATDPTTHPDFENDAYMFCGGRDLGYVRKTIDPGGTVDAAVYEGDNRGPVLLQLNHPTRPTQKCFTSMARFDEWYNDRPPANRSFYTDLVLTRNAQGMYTYLNDDFLPLNPGAGWRKFRPTDPDPFGPRVDITPDDVWGFTMEIHTNFTYQAGLGQVFTFKGDDDVWVFINGHLAIDLGGLHDQLLSTVNLDSVAATYGMQDGGSYPLDFFFAERHSTGSHCQITTSLHLGRQPQLPVPVANPAGRTFRGSIDVALTVPGHSDAEIRYTVDGTEPGPASPLYSAALTFTANTALKARAFKPGFLASDASNDVYTLEQVALPDPVATPPGQTFLGTLSVTLSVPDHPDAVIRYTLNGADPDSASPVYAGSLVFAASDTLKARAFKPQWLPSDVLTEVYLLHVPPNVIGLRMDSTLVDRRGVVSVTYPDPVRLRPIAVVSSEGGILRCLTCIGGTQDVFIRPGVHPEWTVTSKDPFRYAFRIYDHLGHFVVAQSGAVGKELLDAIPGDPLGYRAIRFRWAPVAHDGRSVGTGAYILRGKVVSEPAKAAAGGTGPTGGGPLGGSPNGAEKGRSEMTLLKTFGFVRPD